MRRRERTNVRLLAEEAEALKVGQKGVGGAVGVDAGALGGQLEHDEVVHGIAVVLVPQDSALEVTLLGGVPLRRQEEGEAISGVGDEAYGPSGYMSGNLSDPGNVVGDVRGWTPWAAPGLSPEQPSSTDSGQGDSLQHTSVLHKEGQVGSLDADSLDHCVPVTLVR